MSNTARNETQSHITDKLFWRQKNNGLHSFSQPLILQLSMVLSVRLCERLQLGVAGFGLCVMSIQHAGRVSQITASTVGQISLAII